MRLQESHSSFTSDGRANMHSNSSITTTRGVGLKATNVTMPGYIFGQDLRAQGLCGCSGLERQQPRPSSTLDTCLVISINSYKSPTGISANLYCLPCRPRGYGQLRSIPGASLPTRFQRVASRA